MKRKGDGGTSKSRQRLSPSSVYKGDVEGQRKGGLLGGLMSGGFGMLWQSESF